MMIPHTSQNMNLFKMLCLKLLTYDYSLQLFRFNKLITMYLGAFENQNQDNGENNFGLLEKSHFLSLLRPQPNDRLQNNFQEIFLTTLPPNCSTISTCTQEDRNFEVLSLPDEFYGESVDHFFNEELVQDQNPPIKTEFLEENAPIINKSLAMAQLKTEGQQKDEGPQNCHDETKNIPKNYIKAIFSFIQDDEEFMKKVMSKLKRDGKIQGEPKCELSRFLSFIKEQKRLKKYTIQRLKSLWTHPENGKLMRIISSEFLRRRSMAYIFGSKIEKKMSHIKHRYKFIQAIQNPCEFTSIK